MASITVVNHVTLDGVMQSPGRPDEDTRGGFAHGGWAAHRNDDVMGERLGQGMSRDGGALLFGRRTYQDFAAVWPGQQDNPVTDVLNQRTKYVVSRTLSEPLPWQNSVLLPGEAAESVARLKQSSDLDLTVLGSGELVQTLARNRLVDQYLLMIHPVVLGSGRRLFGADLPMTQLELVDCTPTTTGVLLATYQPKT